MNELEEVIAGASQRPSVRIIATELGVDRGVIESEVYAMLESVPPTPLPDSLPAPMPEISETLEAPETRRDAS
jgi:hypothetical protein